MSLIRDRIESQNRKVENELRIDAERIVHVYGNIVFEHRISYLSKKMEVSQNTILLARTILRAQHDDYYDVVKTNFSGVK